MIPLLRNKLLDDYIIYNRINIVELITTMYKSS